MRFTKPKKVIGLDIGSHSVKAVQMSRSGGKLNVEKAGYAAVDRNQVNVDPVAAQANALREAVRKMAVPQSLIVGALPGQAVVIRYPRFRNVEMADLDQSVQAEAGQNIPYDLSEVFMDWSLLEEESEGEESQLKVLLVATKHEVIDSRVQIADSADIEYGVLSVDSLALADAAEGCDYLRVGETVALINIGANAVSIHFTKDGVSNFIRDVNWGARELIQAIAKSRRCEFEEAERTLLGAQQEIEAESSAVADEEAEVEEVEEIEIVETAPVEESSPADALGGGLLDPLDDELDVLGSSDPPPAPAMPAAPSAGGDADSGSLEDILTAPISRLVSEIRRSFDYYEHQLYERPVERIILSGGAAHLSQIRSALGEDLGVSDVVVANPTDSALSVARNTGSEEFEQHPAQFMVAVGLAARGTADI